MVTCIRVKHLKSNLAINVGSSDDERRYIIAVLHCSSINSLFRLNDFMRDGKQAIHGCIGLKHPSWIAEDPNTPKPVFKANDAEMDKKSKNPLYFEYVMEDSGGIPYQISTEYKFYTRVAKSLIGILTVSASCH